MGLDLNKSQISRKINENILNENSNEWKLDEKYPQILSDRSNKSISHKINKETKNKQNTKNTKNYKENNKNKKNINFYKENKFCKILIFINF